MEQNESQNLNVKKQKEFNALSFDVATVASKVTGVFRIPSFREGLLIVICFCLLMWLLQLGLFALTYDLKVGQASKYDIKAPRDIENREATRIAQNEAAEHAIALAKQDLEYYKIDESVSSNAVYKLKQFFQTMTYERQNFPSNSERIDSLATKSQSFFREPISPTDIKNILSLEAPLYQELMEHTYKILENVLLNHKINSVNLEYSKKIVSLAVAEYHLTEQLKPLVINVVDSAVRENLVLDELKLKKLENQVRSGIPKVMLRQGDFIVTKNQIVTENDMRMLNELHLIMDNSSRIRVFFSLSFLVLLLTGLCLIYIFQFHNKLFAEERLLYLLLLLLLLMLGLIKVLSLAQNELLPYLAPVSFAIMLTTILINPQVALIMTCVVSLLGGIIVNFSLPLSIFYFVSGIISVMTLTNFQRQRDLVRSGIILMVVNTITVLFVNMLFKSKPDYWTVVLACSSGFLSAVLAIGSLPFIEHLFKLTSPIRLLELSNPGHPLLRRLQIEAPGTYHHSIMVGNLAEAAAEGIGADALWVRVGSYYHDIGKIKRPYFFVENQFAQENPHEKLNPNLSTLIITYHVREGAEIAREHGLPDKLIDIIEQHHGTDLVRYFYNKASENAQDDKSQPLEEDFRYEGPKPQTKEAALVMLADSVEAAVKSMPKLTPAKLEALVQKIIRERLEDGQFDECNLTLKDLNQIKNSFIKVLGGLLHTRVEYPEKVLNEIERKKTNAGTVK
ncbi:MAG TPA: HDIG domain-containing protein [Bacillota bacterium]|nr:HDIG domain-containing protein [Bacillota bacterium]HOL09639.1 HDIG domain-containing protein [Bacillota bacterium]HPO98617.1 HDIG domain-containing protein [Bacillota bacterium]